MASYELIHVLLREERRLEEPPSRADSRAGSVGTVSSLSLCHDEEEELISEQLPLPEMQPDTNDRTIQKHLGLAGKNTFRIGVRSGLDPHVLGETGKGPLSSENGAQWQPFWLRQGVLGAFTCLFILFAIAFLTMLVFSQRHNGLLEARKELGILWKFAPTAIFTLVATLWARVELQALRYFPWAVIQHEPLIAHDIYTLDYNAMIPITALFRSIQKKHFFIFFIVLTSIFVKIQVVLGPSLFYVEDQMIAQPAQGQIFDSFATSMSEDRGDLPLLGLYYAIGVEEYGMSRPFGVSDQGAYQTFHLGNEHGLSRGTIDTPATAVVDGIFMDIKCTPLTGYSVSKPWKTGAKENNFVTSTLTLGLEFEGCKQPVQLEVEMASSIVGDGDKVTDIQVLPTSKVPGSWEDNHHPICPSLPEQFSPFGYFGSSWKIPDSTNSDYVLDTYVGAICSPRGWMTRVEVIDDGVSPNVTTLPDEESTQLILNPWDFIQPMLLASIFRNFEGDFLQNNSVLYNSQMLIDRILNVTEIAGPTIMHYQLRYQNESTVVGSRYTKTPKLQVRLNACIPVIVLWVVSAIVAGTELVMFSPIFKIGPRNPTTIIGSALFFGSETNISRGVKQSLLEAHGSQKNAWRHSSYSPPSLRSWVRSSFVLYCLALIITLAVTLQISKTSNGFATVDQGAPSIWWTSVPALAMILIAIYISASDTEIRKLSLHFCAKTRPCHAAELDICLLDMLGFRTLYHSVKLRLPIVTLSQILAMMCAFLAALSSLLFTTVETREWSNVKLEQISTFINQNTSTHTYSAYTNSTMALIFTNEKSNVTWPQGMYRDLLFPTLDTDSLKNQESAGLAIDLVTPAATLRPTCEMVSTGSDIQISNSTKGEPLYVIINNTNTCTGSSEDVTKVSIGSSVNVDGKYYFSVSFGASPYGHCNGTDLSKVKATITHAWGSASQNKSVPDYYAIWKCTYSWWEVSVRVKMNVVDGTLQFDQSEPPDPDYTNIKPWTSSFDMPQKLDDYWITLAREKKEEGGTYGIFSLFIEPFGTMKLQDLGDSTKEEKILELLHSRRAILASLLANVDNRVEVTPSSTSPELSKIDARISFGKTKRLDQNPIVTYIIIAILSMAFLFNMWALISGVLARFLDNKTKWLLDMQMKGVAPDEFGSIMMAESLLLGSNYLNFIPEGSYLEKPKVLHQSLAHLRFRIGGFMRKGAKEKEVTLGVLDDDEFQYLGS